MGPISRESVFLKVMSGFVSSTYMECLNSVCKAVVVQDKETDDDFYLLVRERFDI